MFVSSIINKSIKFLVPSIFTIILLLKLTEKPGQWITDLVLNSGEMIGKESWHKVGEDKNTDEARKELVDELKNFERNFFRNRDKPTKLSQKCDACRAIAYRLDAEFENAEARMGIKPDYNYNIGQC